MRGKRSKQYRKLIQQFSIHFGFREPYQVLVDADFVKDTTRCKMDLVAALERTMHGKVKPLITQCSIRHLYATNTDPSVAAAIEVAKTVCERRRCGHHPDSHPEPLSTLECLSSVVDPGKNGTNKHRYIVASQEVDVRRAMRAVKGVPLVYVSRSVMILEPMAEESRRVCLSGEKGKLRDGFVRNSRTGGEVGGKRKREDSDESGSGSEGEGDRSGKEEDSAKQQDGEPKKKKKKNYGPKQPNPLAVKKSTKKKIGDDGKDGKQSVSKDKMQKQPMKASEPGAASTEAGETGGSQSKPKRKRRRKHKAAAADGEAGGGGGGGGGGGEGRGEGQGGNEASATAVAVEA